MGGWGRGVISKGMSQTLGELIFADLISARRSTGGLNNHEPTETRHRGDMLAALHGGGWGYWWGGGLVDNNGLMGGGGGGKGGQSSHTYCCTYYCMSCLDIINICFIC
jgi:hypothetical protein